jgi:PKD domain
MSGATRHDRARRRLLHCGLASGILLGALAFIHVGDARASFANSEFIITQFGSPTSVVLEYSELQGLTTDVSNQSYQAIATPGAAAQNVTVSSGYSLGEILNLAGISPSSFNYAELTMGAADSTLLSAAEASSAPTSTDPPVFYQDGSGLAFADQVPSGYLSGSSLVYINLDPGPELSVGIKVSPKAVKAGKDVEFTATLNGQAPGASFKYQWDNGTGLTYGGGSPLNHPFAIPGTYYVYATVTGSDGSVGISPEVSFKVGKAPKGPNRNGGGTTKKKKAPTSGPGTKGSANGKSTTSKGKTTASNGSTTATNTTTTAASTTTTPATTTTTAKSAVKPRATHHVAAKKPPRRSGPLLSGTAVTSVRRQPPSAPKPAVAPAGAADPARTGHLVAHHGVRVSEGFWIALGTFAAVLGGAWLEWSGRPRLQLRGRPFIARSR